jgi:hypothetical protein
MSRSSQILWVFAGLGALGLSPGLAWARQDIVPGSRYTSARGAALGDAYLPLSEDSSALFYNPAGIGKVRKTLVEPMNASLELSSGYLGMFDLSFFKLTNLKSFAPTLADHPGKVAGIGASIFPSIVMRGFGFGLLAETQVSGVNDGTNIRYRSQYRLIPTFGTAVRLASGVVRLGYSAQWVNQAVGDNTVPVGTDPLGYNQSLAQGSGISHNAGIAVTLPFEYLPAFNLVARNILGTHYSSFTLYPIAKNKTGVPADDPMTFDASFSMAPKVGPSGNVMNFVVELRDLTNRSSVSLLGRATVGVEFAYRDSVFLRGGWGSGYPNAGIGLKRKTAEFSLSWYSEEIGRSYSEARDSRFMVQYQIRAF